MSSDIRLLVHHCNDNCKLYNQQLFIYMDTLNINVSVCSFTFEK